MKQFIAALLIIGTSAVVLEKKPVRPDYMASDDGFEGHWSYTREPPAHFDGPGSGDDQFMNSMISNYAMEKADKDTGVPTGFFYFNPIAARMAAREILSTHLGLTGDAATAYLDQYFEKTWDHFDTANEGILTTDRMASFFRFLTANMQIVLH